MASADPAVLLIGNFLSATGRNRNVCEDLAERLSSRGLRVLTTSAHPERIPRLVDMVRTAWTRRSQYGLAQVDVYGGPAFVWAEAVCWTLRLARKPYILTLHGGNLPVFSRRWRARVVRLLRSAAVVTTPSRYLLQNMRSYREDLHLLPNPIDLTRYHFRPRVKPRPDLIWLRAFHEVYNPLLAVEALGRLASEFPDTRLTMIGPDKEDGALQRVQDRAGQLGLRERLRLPGPVAKAEVPARLECGDIFINTTNIDNTPISVMEAMASGLCIVSTNVGGIPYLLEHEREALLVPPNDAPALAAAVRRILTEPGLAERLSLHARQAAERFDWSVVLPLWEQLLLSVAGRVPA